MYNEKRKIRKAQSPEKYSEMQAKYARKHYLKTKYNLTDSDLLLMIEMQNNKCKICETQFSDAKLPVIDHCHQTGKVRSLLCSNCNLRLGHIEDDNFLSQALQYIEHYK